MEGPNTGPRNAVARLRARLPGVRARIRKSAPFASGIVAALIAVWVYGLLNPGPLAITRNDVKDTVQQTLASQTPGPAVSELVYAAAQPSLVLIQTKDAHANADGSNGGLGSGVVVDAQGDILTSLHVIADAIDIKITFADGSTSAAEIVARQPENDIAVIRAQQPPANLVPATLGNPNAVHVGDDAYVVGNPFGLYSSMSAGVVSGLGRSFQLPNSTQTIHGLIQVDAAINPGNSGGALLNRSGQLIGIVTGLINPTSQNVFIGIGLAVPIDVAGGAAGLPPY
jgi:S1-C subfamily serine protease